MSFLDQDEYDFNDIRLEDAGISGTLVHDEHGHSHKNVDEPIHYVDEDVHDNDDDDEFGNEIMAAFDDDDEEEEDEEDSGFENVNQNQEEQEPSTMTLSNLFNRSTNTKRTKRKPIKHLPQEASRLREEMKRICEIANDLCFDELRQEQLKRQRDKKQHEHQLLMEQRQQIALKKQWQDQMNQHESEWLKIIKSQDKSTQALLHHLQIWFSECCTDNSFMSEDTQYEWWIKHVNDISNWTIEKELMDNLSSVTTNITLNTTIINLVFQHLKEQFNYITNKHIETIMQWYVAMLHVPTHEFSSNTELLYEWQQNYNLLGQILRREKDWKTLFLNMYLPILMPSIELVQKMDQWWFEELNWAEGVANENNIQTMMALLHYGSAQTFQYVLKSNNHLNDWFDIINTKTNSPHKHWIIYTGKNVSVDILEYLFTKFHWTKSKFVQLICPQTGQTWLHFVFQSDNIMSHLEWFKKQTPNNQDWTYLTRLDYKNRNFVHNWAQSLLTHQNVFISKVYQSFQQIWSLLTVYEIDVGNYWIKTAPPVDKTATTTDSPIRELIQLSPDFIHLPVLVAVFGYILQYAEMMYKTNFNSENITKNFIKIITPTNQEFQKWMMTVWKSLWVNSIKYTVQNSIHPEQERCHYQLLSQILATSRQLTTITIQQMTILERCQAVASFFTLEINTVNHLHNNGTQKWAYFLRQIIRNVIILPSGENLIDHHGETFWSCMTTTSANNGLPRCFQSLQACYQIQNPPLPLTEERFYPFLPLISTYNRMLMEILEHVSSPRRAVHAAINQFASDSSKILLCLLLDHVPTSIDKNAHH